MVVLFYFIYFGRLSCKYFQGDSGGPLFVTGSTGQFIQLGVVLKGGHPCGYVVDKPDIYANVGAFRNWINSVIK